MERLTAAGEQPPNTMPVMNMGSVSGVQEEALGQAHNNGLNRYAVMAGIVLTGISGAIAPQVATASERPSRAITKCAKLATVRPSNVSLKREYPSPFRYKYSFDLRSMGECASKGTRTTTYDWEIKDPKYGNKYYTNPGFKLKTNRATKISRIVGIDAYTDCKKSKDNIMVRWSITNSWKGKKGDVGKKTYTGGARSVCR